MNYEALKRMSPDDLVKCLRQVAGPVLRELALRGVRVRVTNEAVPDFVLAPQHRIANDPKGPA